MIGTKIPYNRKEKEEILFPQEKIDLCFHNNHVQFLYGDIDSESVKRIIQWITYENTSIVSDKTLTLYINSPGGDLYEAFALIDIMKASKYNIRTIGIGQIMSAGFLIFCSGTKGHRLIGKNTGIMCHQLSVELEGKHHDLKATMKENDYCNQRMIDILNNSSNLDERTIKSKLLHSTDVYLRSEELLNFGLADQIL
jgi:ATP-dependent Clp protease, protease subunit